MGDDHGVQRVPGRARGREFRPGDLGLHRAALFVRLGAVAQRGDAPAVETEREARGDVREDGDKDEDGLEREGLVVRPGEEEVFVRVAHVAGDQRDQGGVGVMHREVRAEGREGVFLDAAEDVKGAGRGDAENVCRCVGGRGEFCVVDVGRVGWVGRTRGRVVFVFVFDGRGVDVVHWDAGNRGAGVGRLEGWEVCHRGNRRGTCQQRLSGVASRML